MGLDMSMQVNYSSVAKEIAAGYSRTGGKNWSSVAISTGRAWDAKEHAGLVTFIINAFGLGSSVKSGGFTLFSHSDSTEAKVIRDMDHYMNELSDEYHIIAYWCKAPHIHAWFDNFVYSCSESHITNGDAVGFKADVLHKLRNEIQQVLDVADAKGEEAAYQAMSDLFPLTGDFYEMFSAHSYTPKHIDDLRQTALFFDNLFAIDQAEEATYYYTATW